MIKKWLTCRVKYLRIDDQLYGPFLGTVHNNTDGAAGVEEVLMVEREAFEFERTRADSYRRTLEEIANEDYRGNMPAGIFKARMALKKEDA